MKILIKAKTDGYSIEKTLREIIEAVEKIYKDNPNISYDDVEIVVETN